MIGFLSHAVVAATPSIALQWQSEIVNYDGGGRLQYAADPEGNRIPDFSYAGYRNGEVPIPDIPVVKTISPIAGDNTDHIQAALFEVSFMPRGTDGFRGAVLLTAGTYEIRGTIRVSADGVVLRGVGDGADPAANTILWATDNSPHQRTVLVAGGGIGTKWRDEVAGTRTNITSDSVMVGSRQFEVQDASPFMVGDNIIIYHPCTQAWLTAVDSGGTWSHLPAAEPGVDVPWSVDSQPLVFNRNIVDIQGNTITIDAPVFNHLIRELSQSYIYKYSRDGLRTQIGIENLRIDIDTNGGSDENHAWNGMDLTQIEDGWVRDCTVLHFGLSGFRTQTATRITIENCNALDPVSIVTGGRRYNFNVYDASQQVLFKNCHASNGRHHYMSNGTSWTSGCVFLDCTSSGAYAASEGHRRWSMGLLYDNLVELDGPRPGVNPRLLGLYNRGHFGTSHGWAAAHSVAWNTNVAGGELHVQKPPTAQNYAIGCFGDVTGARPPASFDEPEGYIEGTGVAGLEPRSLYEAQLTDRLGPPVSVANLDTFQNQREKMTFLHPAYPNPFNGSTRIDYEVRADADVRLQVYNILGQRITTLVEERKSPGVFSVEWLSTGLSSGTYLLHLEVDGNTEEVHKVILLQ